LKGIVMAGGRAGRFGRPVDKSCLSVNGRRLLDRSVDALRVSDIDDILVATTGNHQETRRVASSLGIPVVLTSGRGYHEDTMELISQFEQYVSVNVDMPFVRRNHVMTLMRSRPARSVATVVSSDKALGTVDPQSLLTDQAGRTMIWTGLNIVSSDTETALLELEDPLLTVNVNDDRDLRLAEFIAAEKGL